MSVSANGAYDTGRVYQAIAKSSNEDVVVAIPPRKNTFLSEEKKVTVAESASKKPRL